RFAGKAPVAQRIERSPPEREVACSNHAGRVEVLTAAAVRSTALVPFGAFFKGPSRTRTTRRLGASRLCVGVPPCRLLEPSLELGRPRHRGFVGDDPLAPALSEVRSDELRAVDLAKRHKGA